MPASFPGATDAENIANPSDAPFVIFDPLSGPKGSPFDAKVIDYTTGTPLGWDATTHVPILVDNDELSGCSTGGLSTGIGIGGPVIGLTPQLATAPAAILAAGFNDNQTPGTEPTYAAAPPIGVVTTNTVDSTFMYIGGGRMIENPDIDDYDQIGRPFIPDPYDVGVAIVGGGAAVSRDGGAGPAFTGFPLKMVTAAGAVAIGAAIEAGFLNVSGVAMTTGQSAFGSGTTELAAAS